MIKEMFTRRELKFLVPFNHYQEIVKSMAPYAVEDPFADESGHYKIVSLYFESPDHKIYYDTRNKAPFRQKLRLRMYNRFEVTESAFFEIKQKYQNVVLKRRTVLKLNDAYRFITQEPQAQLAHDDYGASNPQVLKEISSLRKMYQLSPKVIVSYERHAFLGKKDKDLRVTFDHHLTCRSDSLLLESGTEGTNFVHPNLVVMEVKVTHSVPLWLARILSDFQCPNQRVSKYCTSVDLVCPILPVIGSKTAL